MNYAWRQADVSRDDYVLLSDVFSGATNLRIACSLRYRLTTNSFILLYTNNNALNYATESADEPPEDSFVCE